MESKKPQEMTPEEFRAYAQTREYTDLTIDERINLVWFRLNPATRTYLFGITRENTLAQIKGSNLEREILHQFKEAKYATVHIEHIVRVVKDFDDGLPLNILPQ